MATSRFAFDLLLKTVNPAKERRDLASTLPSEVREWLQDNDFVTATPHTRLIGSYGRHTAILEIKDVDVLVFLPDSELDRTPNSVLQEVKRVLDEYPDATAETSPQRRSVRLEIANSLVTLDIVPCVARDGLDQPILIPDRPAQDWISTDPLGFGHTLSSANQSNGEKVIPLIKLVKAWRDVQMQIRRPKSYVLEVMVLAAVQQGKISLKGKSTAKNVANFFSHIESKYSDLYYEGGGVPRIADPQLGHIITSNWERTHFETFMRRIFEAATASSKALDASEEATANSEWGKVFGSLWPTEKEIEVAAKAESQRAWPGKSAVLSSGAIAPADSHGSIMTKPTTFHGKDD